MNVIRIYKENEKLIIVFEKDNLGISEAKSFKDGTEGIFQNFQDITMVIVNMSKVEDICSDVVRTLINIHSKTSRNGKDFQIINCQKKIYNLFTTMCLGRFFKVTPGSSI